MSKLRFTLFSLIADAILVNLSIILAFELRFLGSIPAFNFSAYTRIWWIITLAYLAAGWVYGLYEPEKIDSPWSTSRAVFTSVTFGTLVVAAIAFLGGASTSSFARLTLLFSYVIDLVLLIAWRIAFLRFFPIKWPTQRTLILGTNEAAQDLARSCRLRTKWGWDFKGFVAIAGGKQHSLDDDFAPECLLGTTTNLHEILKTKKINRLLIAEPFEIRPLIESIVLDDALNISIDVVPSMYEIFLGTIDSIVGDVPLMHIVTGKQPRYQVWLKRTVDFVGALVLTIVLSPLWLIAGLAILIEDGFPIFYKQQRVGVHLKPFDVYKMRTMVKDAEKLSGPVLASEDDPRITRVGKILRTYRIDELPQLINVLKGSMSFIGPRPERPVFVEEYLETIPGYAERFRIKPGVTGLAQINGGYATTPARKLKYDLMYVYHQSMAMDAQVVIETLKVVLTGKGAR